ncbi:MAG: transcriptional repressor [Oligoflexia bacterium]|nr:transcriptional repressor [Oligoflexia bacterium]
MIATQLQLYYPRFMKATEKILSDADVKITAIRILILELLLEAKKPLSQAELSSHKKISSFDKVTVYRTLETLKKSKLIHRTLSTDGIWRFCSIHTNADSHKCCGNHIHFFCIKCKKTSCMPEVKLPWIEAPEGACIHSKQLLVHGLCKTCFTKEKKK